MTEKRCDPRTTKPIALGTGLSHREGPVLDVVCERPDLRRHLERPWFRAYLRRQLGAECLTEKPRSRQALLSEEALGRHTLLCGASGGGKTYCLAHLAMQQVQAGASLVLLDGKGETCDLMAPLLQAVGLPAEDLIILDPRSPEGVPGFNPLAAGVPVAQAAADLVALTLPDSVPGYRMRDLLTNALIVIGGQGLTLMELVRFLLKDEYRLALLRRPATASGGVAYDEAALFFRDEFDCWTPSARLQGVAAVLNKLREYLRSDFLAGMLSARQNQLDLARLFQKRTAILARLDRASLGEEGMRLLSGLLAHLVFRTALRASGPVPTVLSIDELPVIERAVGSVIADTLEVGRSQNLRLLVACQHLDQLSDRLRASLFANAAIQIFMRLSPADARLAAGALAAGAAPVVTRVVVS